MPNKYPPIVSNKFDPKLFNKPVRCPYCNSKKVHYHNSQSTLLGFIGKVNPNHVWNQYHCQECGKGFTYETKSGEAWYVSSDQEVLKGLPNCFETYVLKCAYCGGKVKREYLSWDNKPVFCISPGRQAEWYFCEDCGKRETLDTQNTSTEDVKVVYGNLVPKLNGTVTVIGKYDAEKLPE